MSRQKWKPPKFNKHNLDDSNNEKLFVCQYELQIILTLVNTKRVNINISKYKCKCTPRTSRKLKVQINGTTFLFFFLSCPQNNKRTKFQKQLQWEQVRSLRTINDDTRCCTQTEKRLKNGLEAINVFYCQLSLWAISEDGIGSQNISKEIFMPLMCLLRSRDITDDSSGTIGFKKCRS